MGFATVLRLAARPRHRFQDVDEPSVADAVLRRRPSGSAVDVHRIVQFHARR